MELLCARCGGSLRPEAADDAVTCQYCGTTSVPAPRVVLVTRVPSTGVVVDSRPPCPRCADFLNDTRVGDTILSGCRTCGGIWIDTATVSGLMQSRDEAIEAAARRIGERASSFAAPDLTLPIACPVCRNHLRRVPRGEDAVDVCDAHGTWFDAFEAARPGAPRGLLSRLFA